MAGSISDTISDTIAKIAMWILSLVVFVRCLFMRLVSIQKISFFPLFFQFVRTLRIQRFHFPLFPGSKLWQVANEQDQFPRILFIAAASTSPGWHPGQT